MRVFKVIVFRVTLIVIALTPKAGAEIEYGDCGLIIHPVISELYGDKYSINEVVVIQQFMQIAKAGLSPFVHLGIDVAPVRTKCCDNSTTVRAAGCVDNATNHPKVHYRRVPAPLHERDGQVELRLDGGIRPGWLLLYAHIWPDVEPGQDLTELPNGDAVGYILHDDPGYHDNHLCHVHFAIYSEIGKVNGYNPFRFDSNNKAITNGALDIDKPQKWDSSSFEDYTYNNVEYYKIPVDDKLASLFTNNCPYRIEARDYNGDLIGESKYEAYTYDSESPYDLIGDFYAVNPTYNINPDYDLYNWLWPDGKFQYWHHATKYSVKKAGASAVTVYDVNGNKNTFDLLTGSPSWHPNPNPPELPAFPIIPPGYEGPLLENHPVFSSAAVCDMDETTDGSYGNQEIATLEYEGYLYVLNADGSERGRKDLTTNPWCEFKGSPAVGDLDNDGRMEIIVAGDVGSSGKLFCYDSYGNYLLKKWDVDIGSGTSATPSLADIDDDGSLDVVIGNDAGALKAYDKDGTLLWSGNVGTSVKRPVAIGDIDGNGDLEIAVIGHNAPAKTTRVKIFNHDGTVYNDGWTYGHSNEEDVYKNGDIILADATADGYLEIIYSVGPRVSDVAKVFIKNKNGYNIANWPVPAKSNGAIMIGDYDPPFGRTLVIGNNTQWNHSGGPTERKLSLYRINTGEELEKIPLVAYNIDERSVIGNIDPDGGFEIVFPGFENNAPHQTKNNLHGSQLSGGSLPAPIIYNQKPWDAPLGVWIPQSGGEPWEGQWLRNGASAEPRIVDVDNNGKTEIIVPDMRSRVHAFRTETYMLPCPYYTQWGQFQHDNLNTGCFEIFAPTALEALDGNPNDHGHAIEVKWANSLDDGVNGIRSRHISKYEVYRRDGTEYPPPPFAYVGEVPAGTYSFCDSDSGIIPLNLYQYNVKAETADGGPGGGPRYAPDSMTVTGVAHDEIPPIPASEPAYEVIDDGLEPMYVHLTWTLSFDDPYFSAAGGDSTGVLGNADNFGSANVTPTSSGYPGFSASGAGMSSDPGDENPSFYGFSEKNVEAAKSKLSQKKHAEPRRGAPGSPVAGNDAIAGGGYDSGANDVENYYVYKAIDGGWLGEPIAVLDPGTDYFDDSGVDYGHLYEYEITAKDSENYSEPCPITVDLTGDTGDGRVIAGTSLPFGADVGHNPYAAPNTSAPAFESGWGASGNKVSRVITCKPNPVTGTATFTITLPAAAAVRLDVYDIAGRCVDTVLERTVSAGGEAVTWTPAVPNGIYIYRLETPTRTYCGRVAVAR
jgi:hypothetical protein